MAINRIISFLNKGHQRSVKAKKHILLSFFFKGGNILIGFILVPITLHYLDALQYGIWLTLTSVLGYFQLFDIGLGNGMRNRFAEAKAQGDEELARTYVSTTYAAMGLIMAGLSLLFLVVHPFIPWQAVFKSPASMNAEMGNVVLAVILLFFLRFFLRLINKVLMADQRPSFLIIFNFIANSFSLFGIFILTRTTEGSLFLVSLVYSIAPVVVFLVATLYFFSKDYRHYRPSWSYVKFEHFDKLIGLGSKFFIIQVASIILFMTDNMIITQLFGPEEVTPYNVAHKYFNIIPVLFGIITTPLWSAITEAHAKGDQAWIRNTIRKSIRLWTATVGLVIIMLLVSSTFYRVWLQTDTIVVPFMLSAVMALYVLMFSFNSIFVMFINGVGKLRLQILTGLFGIVANIPLSYLFGKVWGMGLAGVILATSVSILLSLILRPIQYVKIMNGTAKGIWNA